MVNDEVIGIELPDTVALEIVETTPGVRGNSATGRTKPATLATGHIVQVPEHLEPGTVVRVDTRTSASPLGCLDGVLMVLTPPLGGQR